MNSHRPIILPAITFPLSSSGQVLDDRLVAMNSTALRYIHQDHLTGTSVVTDANGGSVGTMKYHPFGDRRNSQGDLGTDKLFTGQRLDDTGLYYYNARYYDPTIGRFISADTIVSNPANPQSLNRYTYVLNNPLKYIDPTGHQDEWADDSWYESLCETYGVDPGDGIAFVFGPEGFEGTLDTDTFVAWVDETENPFDYISAYDMPEWMQGLGVTNAFYYHADLRADPIVVAELGSDSKFLSFLNSLGFGAITINPYIFIREGDIPKSGNLLGSALGKEEYAHILQQRQDPDFYGNYAREYWQGFLHYGDLEVSYQHISYEQRAQIDAGIREHYEWTPYHPYIGDLPPHFI